MIAVDDVREALGTYHDPVLVGGGSWEDATEVLAAAAREHVSCGQGETIWWCDFHDGAYRMFSYPTCPYALETGDSSDCRMVEAVLTVKGTEQ